MLKIVIIIPKNLACNQSNFSKHVTVHSTCEASTDLSPSFYLSGNRIVNTYTCFDTNILIILDPRYGFHRTVNMDGVKMMKNASLFLRITTVPHYNI